MNRKIIMENWLVDDVISILEPEVHGYADSDVWNMKDKRFTEKTVETIRVLFPNCRL